MKRYKFESKIRHMLEAEGYSKVTPQFEELNGDGSVIYWDADFCRMGFEVRTSIIEDGTVLLIEDRRNDILHFTEAARLQFAKGGRWNEITEAIFKGHSRRQ